MRLRSPESVVDNFKPGCARSPSSWPPMPGWPCWFRRWSAGPGRGASPSPVIVREPVDPFARQFIVYSSRSCRRSPRPSSPCWPAGPRRSAGSRRWSCLSGLAIVLLAGDGIELSHQHIVISAWFGLLLVPPVARRARGVRAALVRRRSQRQQAGAADCAVSSRTASSAAPARRCRSSPAIRARRR